ncbi:MAG TPA: ROK family protein [Acidisoma sp.]|uniref:ROK family protein n=1 Tax=Acidisoma sp. TaxID=1872115 RepID=UPI002D029B74|nr:ROK family protein [Acidisoma sp.]HTI00528.1 ROK family protein [Acidisoma sp.]
MAADLTDAPAPAEEPAVQNILSIDIGGTGLKASVIDRHGTMIADKVRVPTPHPSPPGVLVEAIATLVKPLPHFDRVAIGFPGAVRANIILTAPHLGEEIWHGVDLAALVSQRLGGVPTKIVNDAEMQGLAVIKGQGLEFILTLGTGCGTGIFYNGELAPHLELSTHPIHKKYTYDTYVGNAAFETMGKKRWNKRVERVIALLRSLTHFDHLYIGGGNSKHVTLDLPTSVSLVSNEAGIDGGAALWSPRKGRHPEYDIGA